MNQKQLNENHLKPLADALLPYSYTVKSYDEKTMVLQAGNGTEVTFETISTGPVVASLSDGDDWAVRQVADLLQSHPAFEFTREPHEDIPWRIQFKENVTHFQNVREALLGESPPAAPAAPPKEAPTRPTPRTDPAPSTEPGEKPDPFRPPRPAVMPRPKARKQTESKKKKRLTVNEAYEDEAHSGSRDFWQDLPRNREHPYGSHPIMAMHGQNLAQSSFDHTAERTSGLGGQMDMGEQMQMFQMIMQIEAQHKDQLEQLAKDVTQQVWGVDPNMLTANLGEAGEREPDPEEEDIEISPELRDQINKRITMNALTQGSAVHAMMTAHHMVDQALNEINPTLLNLYNRLAASATHQYWFEAFPMAAEQLLGAVAGTESVDFNEQDEPEVTGNGLIFPILIQEMFKGVMELVTMYQFAGKDEEEVRRVYQYADKLVDEPFLIQVGPELWRRFLRVLPRGAKLADVVSELSRMEPARVNQIVNLVVENPDRAREELSAIQ